MNKVMLSHKEYERIAESILFANASHRVALSIFNDPDKFGEIVTTVMTADWKFNGKGNLLGYRKQRVLWKIKNILAKSSRKFQTEINIQHNIDKISGSDDESYISVDNRDYANDLTKKINSSSVLTDIEKQVIIKKIVDNKTIREIAQDINICYSAIQQAYNRAIKKMGNQYVKQTI